MAMQRESRGIRSYGQQGRQRIGGRGSQSRSSSAEVESSLRGIHFPVYKEEIVAFAQENGASDDVIMLLEDLSDVEYHSPIDISKEIGRIKPRRRSRGPSAANIEQYMRGIHFTAQKEDILRQAQDNGAPDDVISVLEQLEDGEYYSVIDISKEISRIKPGRGRGRGSRAAVRGGSSAISRYLRGASYPATKDDLIMCAEENNASDDILDKLEQLSDEEFESERDVTRVLNRLG